MHEKERDEKGRENGGSTRKRWDWIATTYAFLQNSMNKIIKITLAILFILCLLKLPYGFYQFVRFLSFAGFCFLAYEANEQKNIMMTFVFVGLALLFQPFLKIALGRELWNLLDVILAIFLLSSIFSKEK